MFWAGFSRAHDGQHFIEGAHSWVHKHGHSGHSWNAMGDGARLVKHDAACLQEDENNNQ